MTIGWHDLPGVLGSAMIIIAYLALQLDRLKSHDVSYLMLNGVGAALILVSLLFAFNLAAFIIELFWVGISVLGLVRASTAARRRTRG